MTTNDKTWIVAAGKRLDFLGYVHAPTKGGAWRKAMQIADTRNIRASVVRVILLAEGHKIVNRVGRYTVEGFTPDTDTHL